MIKRGSSVDQVGMPCSSNVSASNPMTGMVPIALPDAPMPPSTFERPEKAGATGCDSTCGGNSFKANTGYENP